jgi:hypothetical protein
MISILLAALLSTPPAVGPADSLDACGLYTRDEVAKFAGETAKKPREFTINPAVHSSCTTATNNYTVKVFIERSANKTELQDKLKALKGVAKSQTSQSLTPVSGLGDEAYWGQVNPTNGQFHVVVGSTLVNIQTFGKGPGAGTMAKTRPIADIVVKRYKERYGSK